MASTTATSATTSSYHSHELEQLQALPHSPFGLQFFLVPVSSAPVSSKEEASTRTCDETSNDGKSQLDCIDDDD